MLSSIMTREGCHLLQGLVPSIQRVVSEFFELAVSTGDKNMRAMGEGVRAIISTPGTTLKKKLFRDVENRRRYSNHVVPFVLFLLRLHVAHCNEHEIADSSAKLTGEVL